MCVVKSMHLVAAGSLVEKTGFTAVSYFLHNVAIIFCQNIISLRSNRSKTFLMCNQALRVPTEICDSKNISVCIKSRVDNLFKFLCSSAALKLLLLKSLLLLLSLPNLYKCFSFAQLDSLPVSVIFNLFTHCIEGNLQKM